MENVDKRVDVKLKSNWKKRGRHLGVEGLISRPNFHSVSIFSENLVAVQMNRVKVTYDKPIYVGFCILELSKLHMYDFYYDFLKKKYANNATLLYIDTDAFLCEIKADDVYSDICENLNYFDTSNYLENNQFNIPLKNKAELGKFKDECAPKILCEFIGLRSKMYALKIENEESKKAKGVKKSVIKHDVTFQDYKNVLLSSSVLLKEQYKFKSIKHDIYTQKENKIALSSNDDKRYLLPNTFKTLAWGHYKIPLDDNNSDNNIL